MFTTTSWRRRLKRSGTTASRRFAPTCANGCAGWRRTPADGAPSASSCPSASKTANRPIPPAAPTQFRSWAGCSLRGSIDLIERHRGGSVRVTDHKTGKVRANHGVVVGGGKVLQPVLYALAAEKLLAQRVEAGRLILLHFRRRLRGSRCRTRHASCKTATERPTNKTARDVAGEVVKIIGGALATHFFPPLRTKGECNWCDYRMVCGPHEELRAGRKPAARIKGPGPVAGDAMNQPAPVGAASRTAPPANQAGD